MPHRQSVPPRTQGWFVSWVVDKFLIILQFADFQLKKMLSAKSQIY